jgi:hypothetical protein
VALFGIRFAACTVLTVMLLPSCSWQTHVQLPRVESESQSSRFRPAEVRRIFALSACYRLSPSPSHLRGLRARRGDGGGGT